MYRATMLRIWVIYRSFLFNLYTRVWTATQRINQIFDVTMQITLIQLINNCSSMEEKKRDHHCIIIWLCHEPMKCTSRVNVWKKIIQTTLYYLPQCVVPFLWFYNITQYSICSIYFFKCDMRSHFLKNPVGIGDRSLQKYQTPVTQAFGIYRLLHDDFDYLLQ